MDPMMLTGLAGLGAGLAAAGLAGPLACAWPAKGQALLRRLNAVKLYRNPGAVRAGAGGVCLAILLSGGALTAYAAAPSEPERQPAPAEWLAPHAGTPAALASPAPTLFKLAGVGRAQDAPSLPPTAATAQISLAAPASASPPAALDASAAQDPGAAQIRLTKAETDQAESVILDKCVRCHSADPIVALHQGRDEWRSLLGSMADITARSQYDPVLSRTETDLVLRYLVQNFGPPAKPDPVAKG